MANEEIKKELDALRAEVARLAAVRREAEEERSETPDTNDGTVTTPTASAHEGVMGHVEELIGLLEHEIKETPVVAGLAIFGLGVLVGRFMR